MIEIRIQIHSSTLKFSSLINLDALISVLIKRVEYDSKQTLRCAVQTCLMPARLLSLFANWYDETISVIYLISPELATHLISICSSSGFVV